MKCHDCGEETEFLYLSPVGRRSKVVYKCPKCGFIQRKGCKLKATPWKRR